MPTQMRPHSKECGLTFLLLKKKGDYEPGRISVFIMKRSLMSITAHTLPPCRGKVAEGRGVGGSVHIFVGACAFLWSTLPLPSAALPPGEPRLQIGVCWCALKKCFHCEPVRLSGVAIPWLNGTRLRFPSKSAAPNFTGTFRYISPLSKGIATPLKRTGLAMT